MAGVGAARPGDRRAAAGAPAPDAGSGQPPGPAGDASWFGLAGTATEDPASTADLGELLPRRVRQASLAPQLRTSAPGASAAPGGQPPGDEMPGDRSPEQARATLAAIQQGWQRGRLAADAAQPDAGPAAAAQSPAESGAGPAPGAD